ncbi:MAG TPA: Ig-like domain-containing protein [Longimicrobium sp.]
MRPPRLAAAACALTLALAACTDRNPAAIPAVAPPLPPSAVAAVRCTADVRAGTLACAPAPMAAAGVSAAILGGQGTNVRLASSGTSYDGVGIFRSYVTLENLTMQPLGTSDGFTPVGGSRVFFASGPTTTSGTGEVSVANADGIDAFTASSQPYFLYASILLPGDTTGKKEWRFNVPSTVGTFQFLVYVAARVPSEDGWVSLFPIAPSLQVGDTVRMDDTVHTVTGSVVPGVPAAWSSSNPAVATVDAGGVVTAVDTGTAIITATSGARTGRVTVQVSSGPPPPTFVRLDILPPTITTLRADTAWMQARVRNAGLSSAVTFAVGPEQCIAARVSGTAADGVYRCGITARESTTGGIWAVTGVVTGNGAGIRELFHQDLTAAGAPAAVFVHHMDYDLSPPLLLGFGFSPDTAHAGTDTVEVEVVAADSGVGVAQMEVRFSGPWPNQAVGCGTNGSVPGPNPGERIFRCRFVFPDYVSPGDWLARVDIEDLNGRRASFDPSGLAAKGWPSTLAVISPNPDHTNPVLTAFSMAPGTVVGNGTDSLSITVTATDAQAGMLNISLQLLNADDSDARYCSVDGPPGPSLTLHCTKHFDAADVGTWRVGYVDLRDLAGNGRTLYTDDLAGVPYPTTVVVTAP